MKSDEKALFDFFTRLVPVRACPAGIGQGEKWWEERGGWMLPWRIMGYEGEVAQGYPCGEPLRKEDYQNSLAWRRRQ